MSPRLSRVAVASAVPKRPRSGARVAALVAGVCCLVLVGIGAVWPLTLKIQTPQGTVTWNCGTRVSARHYSLAQAASLLHDTRPLTVGNYTYSASRVAQIDKAPHRLQLRPRPGRRVDRRRCVPGGGWRHPPGPRPGSGAVAVAGPSARHRCRAALCRCSPSLRGRVSSLQRLGPAGLPNSTRVRLGRRLNRVEPSTERHFGARPIARYGVGMTRPRRHRVLLRGDTWCCQGPSLDRRYLAESAVDRCTRAVSPAVMRRVGPRPPA